MSPAVPPVPGGVPARGPQDDDAAVAGLAREVDALRRVVDGLAGLPERVNDLITRTGELTQAVAALTARRAATPCPSWLLAPADADLVRELLEELCGWLAAVFLRYPDGADHLPECWLWHPDVVEELLWLMHAWAAAYQGAHASVALVGDWHDRQRPGVVRRIIEVSKDERIGWSPTTLPEQTRASYAVVLAELERVLVLFRSVEITGSGKTSKPVPPVVCGCGRKLRVGKTMLAEGPILCGLCGTEFTTEDSDGEEPGNGNDSSCR